MPRWFLPSLKGYKARTLKNDLVAGLVVAALTIPVAMGYAEVAGLPPVYGLYASILPVVGYALFASNPLLVYGIDASASAITGSLLAAMGIASASADALALAPLLSFFVGVFLLLFSVFKLGRFASFISFPVMSGFISGVAVSIIVGQLPKILGLQSAGTNFWGNLASLGTTIGQTNWISALMGAVTILVILLFKKLLPKVPFALVMLVLGTLVTALLGLDQRGVTITGTIPSGLPPLHIPDFSHIGYLGMGIGGGFVIAVVIFADSLLTTNSFAIQNDFKVDDNQELRAFSISNLVSALFGTSPTSASVSRTAAGIQFRGKTQVVSLTAAALVALVVLLLSGPLYYMPQPVLSGIIIAALVGVVDVKVFKMLWRRSRTELVIWIVSALGVLLIGVLAGVIIGVFLSFIDVVLRGSAPPQATLGVIDGKPGYYDMARWKEARPVRPDVVIYRFTAALFFANIKVFQKGIGAIAAQKPRAIVVDASGINSIDITAAQGLKETIHTLADQGIQLYFAGQISALNDKMSRYGLKDFVQSGHVRKTIGEAVASVGAVQAAGEAKESGVSSR